MTAKNNSTGNMFGGDLDELVKQDRVGPIKVYLETSRKYSDEEIADEDFDKPEGALAGELVQELYLDFNGDEQWRNERSDKPFLSAIYYDKWHRTPEYLSEIGKAQRRYAELTREPDEKDPTPTAKPENDYDEKIIRPNYLLSLQVANMVAEWDLRKAGKVVSLDVESILAARIPQEILYLVLSACMEYNRVPKTLRGKSSNTTAQTE